MIRTLIVDDDPFVRMSLQTILEAQDDVEVCALGADGDEAVELFERERPDVLLMDIQMPGSDGLGAAERILGAHKHARIVFLTTFSDDEYIVRALRLGAKGYLIKQEVATIAPALRTVMAGQSVLGGEVLDRMDVLMSRGPACAENAPGGEMRSGLTERESAIVELVAEGLDNKEIAARLYLSEGTVRNHISAILQKLDLTVHLPFNGPGNSLERVHILHLCSCAQFVTACLTDGQVDICTQGTFLHLAVRNTQILQNHPQLFQVSNHFVRAAHIRFTDNFDQWHTASVIINNGAVFPLIMNQFSCILFHVDLMNADALLHTIHFNVHMTISADRQIKL